MTKIKYLMQKKTEKRGVLVSREFDSNLIPLNRIVLMQLLKSNIFLQTAAPKEHSINTKISEHTDKIIVLGKG